MARRYRGPLERAADELLKANPLPPSASRPRTTKSSNLQVMRVSEDLSKPPPSDPEALTEDQRDILELTNIRPVPKPVPDHSKHGTKRGPGGRLNLRAVADACVDAGLDPAAEIVRVLQAKKPALDRAGKPILGPDGLPIEIDEIDMDTRLRTLNEILQYCQPKLKAVEVKMSGSLEIPSEQLDQRLQALIAKAVK